MLFPDHTDDKKLTLLLRRMRRYNPIPSKIEYGPGLRNTVMTKIIEDPNFRDSGHSYFLQAADLAAFLLYQRYAPSDLLRRPILGELVPDVSPQRRVVQDLRAHTGLAILLIAFLSVLGTVTIGGAPDRA